MNSKVRDEIFEVWEHIVFDLRTKVPPFGPSEDAYAEYARVKKLYLDGYKILDLSVDEVDRLLGIGWTQCMYQEDYQGALGYVNQMRAHPLFSELEDILQNEWRRHACYSYCYLGKEEAAIAEVESIILSYGRGYDSHCAGLAHSLPPTQPAHPKLISLALHVLKRKRARKSLLSRLEREAVTNGDVVLVFDEFRKRV